MSDRPDPDQLLTSIQAEDQPVSKAGRLKVFFGAAPGVGKTYAMLEEARKAASEEMDVVIGYAEPHIRPETESLLLGLEILKYKLVEYRGTVLKEFDLDAALARKPRLICVDELAHTNAPGLRHQKRWQDIFELLDAGIDVFTTLNVQHLESVNDIVQQITGIEVKETLPDEVLNRADEIELIDTTPEELTERLREGKIYRPDIAERAIRLFFNKGNLTALREMALRRTAERVDAQMQEHRQKARVRNTWAASERVLVCVGPSPLSPRLVRSARRLASSLKAPWIAATVEIPSTTSSNPASREQTSSSIRLAQQLGAETITLAGDNVAQTLTDYARKRNVTKIVIGKTDLPRWKERLFGSLVDEVIRLSGDIDVYVIRGESVTVPKRPLSLTPSHPRSWNGYLAAILSTGVATTVGWLMLHMLHVSEINVLMVYLLSILLISWRYNRRASALAAFLSVLTFDFLFVKPYLSFSVTDQQYIFTFAVMLLTGLLIGTLMNRIKSQALLFRRRQIITQALLEFTTELSQHTGIDAIAQVAASRVGAIFDSSVEILLRNPDNALHMAGHQGTSFTNSEKEMSVAQWVFEHNEAAGISTATLPMSAGYYLPLRGENAKVLGILAIKPSDNSTLTDIDHQRLLESLALQSATAIERAMLTENAREAWRRFEQENLRNTLLSSVSHDLRTPLTAITGSASALAEPALSLNDNARQELANNILNESRRMERVITNLLDITRLEAGSLPFNKQPVSLSELVESVLSRLSSSLQNRKTNLIAPDHQPDIVCDPIAIDQVVTNLLENAIQHTPDGTPIDVQIAYDDQSAWIEVADHGKGIPDGQENRIFDKFTRISPSSDRRGLGLGLAISRAIVEAHGGRIEASNRPGSGAAFRFYLPRGVIPADS